VEFVIQAILAQEPMEPEAAMKALLADAAARIQLNR